MLGDSTSAYGTWVGDFGVQLRNMYPTHTVQVHWWNSTNQSYDAAEQWGASGSGSRVIHIWGAGVGGTSATHHMTKRWKTAVVATNADLAIVSYGHNSATDADSVNNGPDSAVYLTLTQSLSADLPECQIVMVAQNPRTTDSYSELHRETILSVCAQQGYGFVDLIPVFKANPSWGTDYLNPDGIHPNPTGYSLIWTEMKRILTPRKGSASLPQKPSTLLTTGENRLYNSRFEIWPDKTTVPDGWEIQGGSVELSNQREKSFTPIRHYALSTGNFLLMQNLNADADFRNYVRGKFWTLGARVRIPTEVTGIHLSFPFIRVNTEYKNGASISGHTDDTGGFVWLLQVFKMPDISITDLLIGVWSQVFTGTYDITVDRMVLSEGGLPREWSAHSRDLLVGQVVNPITGDRGDTALNLTSNDVPYQFFNTPLTQNRDQALQGGRTLGQTFRLIRGAGATGAFTLRFVYAAAQVGASLTTPGTWTEVTWNGSTYIESGGGTLG